MLPDFFKQYEQVSNIVCTFSDPFCISASPKSHYIPSLVCETTNKLKNTILT